MTNCSRCGNEVDSVTTFFPVLLEPGLDPVHVCLKCFNEAVQIQRRYVKKLSKALRAWYNNEEMPTAEGVKGTAEVLKLTEEQVTGLVNKTKGVKLDVIVRDPILYREGARYYLNVKMQCGPFTIERVYISALRARELLLEEEELLEYIKSKEKGDQT